MEINELEAREIELSEVVRRFLDLRHEETVGALTDMLDQMGVVLRPMEDEDPIDFTEIENFLKENNAE